MPHDDCVEKAELLLRVQASPRGACFALPARVLKRMITQMGCGQEASAAGIVEKAELARFVMAARALERAAAQAAPAAPQQTPGTRGVARPRGRAAGDADHDEPASPACAPCCTVS